jgi:NTE family protein
MTDSADAKDYSKAENRTFIFSQETTPNTPVALAIQASIAMPGIWDPVQMVDPTTGREMTVVDGGVIDAMPMGYGHDGLPEVGLSLLSLDSDNPNDPHNSAVRKPVQGGDVDVGSILTNSINSYKMNQDAAANADDFRDRVAPKPGQFSMSVPVWNLKNPHQQSTLLGYGFDPVVDPVLDQQGRQLTQAFLRENMGKFGDPTASGTNVTDKLPEQVKFDVQVENEGHRYRATYGGGDTVRFQALDGSKDIDLKLGKQKIDALWLDDAAFKDLPYQLSYQLDQDRRPIWEKVWEEISPI